MRSKHYVTLYCFSWKIGRKNVALYFFDRPVALVSIYRHNMSTYMYVMHNEERDKVFNY